MKKRVLLMQQRQWGVGIGHELAKRFQADGCRLAAFTAKRTTDKFTRTQNEVKYDLILNHDEIKESNKEIDISLEEICQTLGEISIWPFVYTVRNDVYSYSEKYYYSYRQNRSDDQIINYVKAIYVAVKAAMDEFQPECVVMPNYVSLFQIMVSLMARERGIKPIGFTDSKIRGVVLPFYSPYLDKGPFIDRVEQLNDGVESPNSERAADYIAEFRNSFIKPDYLRDTFSEPRGIAWIKQELRPCIHSLRFLLGQGRENRIKSQGITIDYRPPRIILRDHYAAKRYRKAALSRTYTSLEDLGKYVYFPLQMQPEAQIDMLATNFANQIETARQIALALPGDYTLAVKEHPSMVSRRPPSYHEKLARLPNVKLLFPYTPTQELLRTCGLIVSSGSTTLAEAAFYGKPAIQFGRLGTSLMLPNVYRHTDMTTLGILIRDLLEAGDLKSQDYERRLQNYVAAAYDAGFEMNLSRVWYEGGSAEEYDTIYSAVLKALAC